MNDDHDEFINKPAETIPEADPVTGTVRNPSDKLIASATDAEREAAKLREQRGNLEQRPGPADTSARTTVGHD